MMTQTYYRNKYKNESGILAKSLIPNIPTLHGKEAQ
jgi:hypothetical protein